MVRSVPKLAGWLAVVAAGLTSGSAGPAELAAVPEDVIDALGDDDEAREAFVAEVREWLGRADPLERTYLVSSWAVSPSGEVRAAIARALAGPVPVLGARSVLEHLAQDPTAEVRSAALTALAARAS